MQNLKAAYKAACESTVLLKNEGILLFKTKKVAVMDSVIQKQYIEKKR